MNSENRLFFIVALACEAKPLIAHYHLKKQTEIKHFTLYHHGNVFLLVTGAGKIAMAAGLAYSQGLLGGNHPILINAGIAGHKNYDVGTAFIGHKLVDADTGRNFYPPLSYTLPCRSEVIKTASKPQLSYDHEYLCDMEASAFYEVASRFSTGELIQCFKVVSDNQSQPAHLLEAGDVSCLIDRHIPMLEILVAELRQLQAVLVSWENPQVTELTERFRLTFTEKARLKNFVQRWQVISSSQRLEIDTARVKTGRDLLDFLERKLKAMDYGL